MKRVVLFATFGVVLLWGSIVFVSEWIAEASCKKTADRMELPFEVGFLEGCLVQVQGHWLPLTSYQVLGNVD